MATWNELFLNEEFIAAVPQPEVYKFVKVLESKFFPECFIYSYPVSHNPGF